MVTLTDTLAGVSGEAGAVVALQPSLSVAGEHLGAGLAPLPGTHLAAPAAIQHQRHSRRALRGRTGAEAGPITQLAQHLHRQHVNMSQVSDTHLYHKYENHHLMVIR